ncbi:MAG: porin family protein, partial [Psychromonas sp.]|nr:porin family protein [Psychromonas sp.]
LGSELLGDISLFLLDPVDSIGRNINYLVGHDILKAGTGYFTLKKAASPDGRGTESQIGLNVSYKFGGSDNEALTNISTEKDKYSSYRSQNVDPVDTGIVGLSAGEVWVNLDKKWGMDDAYGQQVSVGLYFTRNFSTRLNYSRAEVKKQQTKSTIVYENYGLDMQYYLNTASDWRPFITTGIGEIQFEQKRSQKYLQFNGGVGLHYKINNNWALQSDWRHYYSTQTDNNDNQLGVAVIYRFGKGEWSL